jgi:hypothetical protein
MHCIEILVTQEILVPFRLFQKREASASAVSTSWLKHPGSQRFDGEDDQPMEKNRWIDRASCQRKPSLGSLKILRNISHMTHIGNVMVIATMVI